MSVAGGLSLPLCLFASLPPLLIYPLKIRIHVNRCKIKAFEISNLSASPANALRRGALGLQPPASCFEPTDPNRNSSGLEFRLTHRKQSLLPKSNRSKMTIGRGSASRATTGSRGICFSFTSFASSASFLLIDTQVETELALTSRKQRTAVHSNRYKTRTSSASPAMLYFLASSAVGTPAEG